jgi:hypothetical protein
MTLQPALVAVAAIRLVNRLGHLLRKRRQQTAHNNFLKRCAARGPKLRLVVDEPRPGPEVRATAMAH